MFTRQLGKAKSSTYIYYFIITTSYMIIATISAFIANSIILSINYLQSATESSYYSKEAVILIFSFFLALVLMTIIFHLTDKPLYKFGMMLKIERISIFKSYNTILPIILILSMIIGFFIAREFFTSKNLSSSIVEVFSNLNHLFVNEFKSSITIYKASNFFPLNSIIVYLLLSVTIAEYPLKSRKAFIFNFDDGIYIDGELVEFNSLYLYDTYLTKRKLKNRKIVKERLYDFFTLYYLCRENYKLLTKEESLTTKNKYALTTVYVSKRTFNNKYIVASFNKKSQQSYYYYLTNVDVKKELESINSYEEEYSYRDLINANDKIIINPLNFNEHYLYISTGKVSILKSILSIIASLVIFATLMTITSFIATSLVLLINLDHHYFFVGLFRFIIYLLINIRILKYQGMLFKHFKLESFTINHKLFIITTTLTFFLYNAGIFIAVEFNDTHNILEAISYTYNNYFELFIEEININMLLLPEVRLPVFFTIISKIAMFIALLLSGASGNFDVKDGIYINKELVKFKNVTTVLYGKIAVEKEQSSNFSEHSYNIIKYFDQIEERVFQCYPHSVYQQKYEMYDIYYGFCRSLRKCIVLVKPLKDYRTVNGKVERDSNFSPSSYIVCDSKIISIIEGIAYDKNVHKQWQFT